MVTYADFQVIVNLIVVSGIGGVVDVLDSVYFITSPLNMTYMDVLCVMYIGYTFWDFVSSIRNDTDSEWDMI